MGARGPRSAASLAIVTPITDYRPPPPDELTAAQADEWRRIVARMPGNWFPAETWPLLIALCRHICTARELAAMVDEFRREWIAEDGGLERYERLLRLRDREHRGMAALATKLRLTCQARYTPGRAATEAAKGGDGRAPWAGGQDRGRWQYVS